MPPRRHEPRAPVSAVLPPSGHECKSHHSNNSPNNNDEATETWKKRGSTLSCHDCDSAISNVIIHLVDQSTVVFLFLNICVHNGVYCVYLTEIKPLNATNFAGEKPQTNSEQQVVLLRNNLSTEKVKGMRHANISWHTFKSFISVSGV